MPHIDVECTVCHRVEDVYRHHSEWPKTPNCSKCGSPTKQALLPSSTQTGTMEPVVVYQAPDGSFRFPPATTSLSTKMYDDKGYTRIELRNFTDVRRFETKFNKREMSEVRRRVEQRQAAFEEGEAARRSEVRRGLEQGFQVPEMDDRGKPTGRMRTVRLSERGRDIMRAAMERNDRKGGPKAYETGGHVEVFSYDRSNRHADPHRRGQ